MAKQSFSKFIRPEVPSSGLITDRDLDIIEAILRYRFSPASELVRLAAGNEDVTRRRLRRLWERGLINRWAFPGIRTHSEFHYYLDNRQPLNLLIEHGRLMEIHPQMLEDIRNNREKDYAGAATSGQHMRLGFLKHSLMMSRLHFMLEMACRSSGAKMQLEAWCQDSQLSGHKVEVARVKSSREGNQYFWAEGAEIERLPVEPDAMFTLRFAGRPGPEGLAHFFYEADRGTMNMTDMLKKMRAYHHFIVRQQLHKQAFGFHPIRAVLMETSDEERGKKLMALATHPLVCGPGKRTGLFWFTISPLFTDLLLPAGRSALKGAFPRYFQEPEIVLDRIWALPDRSLHALSDPENSGDQLYPLGPGVQGRASKGLAESAKTA